MTHVLSLAVDRAPSTPTSSDLSALVRARARGVDRSLAFRKETRGTCVYYEPFLYGYPAGQIFTGRKRRRDEVAHILYLTLLHLHIFGSIVGLVWLHADSPRRCFVAPVRERIAWHTLLGLLGRQSAGEWCVDLGDLCFGYNSVEVHLYSQVSVSDMDVEDTRGFFADYEVVARDRDDSLGLLRQHVSVEGGWLAQNPQPTSIREAAGGETCRRTSGRAFFAGS